MIHLAVNIKQVKGSANLIQQAEFVQNNLNGKISFDDNNLVLSVPLKIELPESTGTPVSTNDNLVTKEYVDNSIEEIKGTASTSANTLGKLEGLINSLDLTGTGVRSVTATANYNEGTTIGTITVDGSTVTFKVNLSSYAPLNSPEFTGAPVTDTPDISTDNRRLATTGFVQRIKEALIDSAVTNMNTIGKIAAALNNDPNYYSTVNTALSSKLNASDITVTGSTGSGTVIGTIALGSDSYEFKVNLAPYALLDSPELTGTPEAPTAAKGTNTKQIATTAFVTGAISDIKGSPSEGLNTLGKISTALGNDSLFAANVNSALNNKQPLSLALSSIASLTTSADKMIYTTDSNTYAVTSLSQAARNLLDDVDVATMRNTLDVPKKDGTGATGNWSITAATATNAVNAENDSAGNPISTTYLKVSDHHDPDLTPYALKTDIKDVSVTNTIGAGTRIGTITIGTTSTDLNVSFAGYASLGSPAFEGSPTAPTVADQDDDSTKIATTAFVAGAIRRLVGTTPEELNTLQELAAALNNEPNFASSIASVVSGKQDKSDALTSIAGLTTSANKMIYTTSKDVYATTDLSDFVVTDNVLGSSSAAVFRSRIGALGSSEKAASATTADSATTATTATNATNAVNDSDGKQISTNYVKISSLHNLTSATHLGWASAAADSVKAVSVNALKNWNGRYNSTTSNLAYCSKGAFGDIVTYSPTDFLTKADADTYYKDISYSPDLSGYLTTTAASSTYLGKTAKAASATTADSATTATTCTGNAATATALKTGQTINIANSDGTSPTAGTSFDGSAGITLKLPATIKADLSGNASTATGLLNARSISIKDADGTYTGTAINFDGTSAATQYIKLPATIKAALDGNASTATALQTAQTIKIANSDGTDPTAGTSFKGNTGITLLLPATIKADINGTATTAISATNDSAGNQISTTYLKVSDYVSPDLSGYATTATVNSLLHLISHYTVCSTAAGTAAKTVTISAISSYALATGNRVTVKFSNTNTAANPTLSVNGTTAKAIHYRGSAIPAAALQANSTYDLAYNGTAWEIVGSVIWAE